MLGIPPFVPDVGGGGSGNVGPDPTQLEEIEREKNRGERVKDRRRIWKKLRRMREV